MANFFSLESTNLDLTWSFFSIKLWIVPFASYIQVYANCYDTLTVGTDQQLPMRKIIRTCADSADTVSQDRCTQLIYRTI
jgi:hypothetical protein